MAEIIWTEPAVSHLDEIAEYIALDNPVAASILVENTFSKVDRSARLQNEPEVGFEQKHSGSGMGRNAAAIGVQAALARW